jgi:hypothetical protein
MTDLVVSRKTEITTDYLENIFAAEEFINTMLDICKDPEARKTEGAFAVASDFRTGEFKISRQTRGRKEKIKVHGRLLQKYGGHVLTTRGYSVDSRNLMADLLEEFESVPYFCSFHLHPKDYTDYDTLLCLLPSSSDLLRNSAVRKTLYFDAVRLNVNPINGIFQRHEGNLYLLIYQEKDKTPLAESEGYEQQVTPIDGFRFQFADPRAKGQVMMIKAKKPVEQVRYVAGIVERLTPFQAAPLVYERRNGLYTLTEESRSELPRFAHTVEFYPLPQQVEEVQI